MDNVHNDSYYNCLDQMSNICTDNKEINKQRRLLKKIVISFMAFTIKIFESGAIRSTARLRRRACEKAWRKKRMDM